MVEWRNQICLLVFGHLMWRVDSLEKLWCWEGLGAGQERDDRGLDGWMASLTRWTWVWVNSGNWWCTGKPGVLWFMGSQRVGHDWATDLIWTDLIVLSSPRSSASVQLVLCENCAICRCHFDTSVEGVGGTQHPPTPLPSCFPLLTFS